MSSETKDRLEKISEVIIKNVGLEEQITLSNQENENLKTKLIESEKEKNSLTIKNSILQKLEDQNKILNQEKENLVDGIHKKGLLISELRKTLKYYSNNFDHSNLLIEENSDPNNLLSSNLEPGQNMEPKFDSQHIYEIKNLRDIKNQIQQDYKRLLQDYQKNTEELQSLRDWKLKYEGQLESQKEISKSKISENLELDKSQNPQTNGDQDSLQNHYDKQTNSLERTSQIESLKIFEFKNSENASNNYAPLIEENQIDDSSREVFDNKANDTSESKRFDDKNSMSEDNDSKMLDELLNEDKIVSELTQNNFENPDNMMLNSQQSINRSFQDKNNSDTYQQTVQTVQDTYLDVIQKAFGWTIKLGENGEKISFSSSFINDGTKDFDIVLAPTVQLLDCPNVREFLRSNPHLYDYLEPEKMPLFFSNAIIIGNATGPIKS